MFGGAFADDFAAGFAGFGAEVDDPIGFGDEVEVVFDDDDGVAGVDEALDDFDEAADIADVQADGGFFEDEKVLFVGAEKVRLFFEAGEEMRDEFDALGFAAAERGTNLAEFEIVEARVAQSFEGAADFWMGSEVVEGFRDA